jgi:hypothetical protein
MKLVTRSKANNNSKYAMGGGFGEPRENVDREDVNQQKEDLETYFRHFYTGQLLDQNKFNSQESIYELFDKHKTDEEVLIVIAKNFYREVAATTSNKRKLKIQSKKIEKNFYSDERKIAITELKPRLIELIESNGITFGPKVEQIEPSFQSQIADARQEVKPAPAMESEEPQFPELRVKIDRAVDIYSSITSQNKESYRGFGVSKLSLFIATVIDREGLSTCHISTSENHDSKLGKTISLSEAQPIVDYINITLEQFSKLPEEAKTLILNNFPREKDSLYFDSLGSYLIERQRIFDEYNNFSDTIPEDQESNDITTFPELVKFKLDILDLDFENYKIYYPSHFKKYTNLDTLDAALHVSYFGAICANEYNSQDGYQFKDKLDQAYFCEMMPIPNGKLESRINENFRLETIETKEFLNDFYSKFLPGYNSETVTSDQAPKPNAPNAFAQSVLDGLQYSQEGKDYIWGNYPKEVRNSNSNRGRAKLMQLLEADVRLNDFLVPVEGKVVNETKLLTFAEKIQSAIEYYNALKLNPDSALQLLLQLIPQDIQFKSLILNAEKFTGILAELKVNIAEAITLNAEIDSLVKDTENKYNQLFPGQKKLIDDAFPDQELTLKTPENKATTIDLRDYASDFEEMDKVLEDTIERYKLEINFYKKNLIHKIQKYQILNEFNSVYFAIFVSGSLCHAYSYNKKINGNFGCYTNEIIKTAEKEIKEHYLSIDAKLQLDQKFKQILGESYQSIAELKEIENTEILQSFVRTQFPQYNPAQIDAILSSIFEQSPAETSKLINDIGRENKRKSAKYKIGQIISSILGFDELKPTEPAETSSEQNPINDNEKPLGTSSNQNEDVGNSGGNNNLPPNRPKTAESNEDNSFDERFILLLEFINNNFGEQRDELITKLLTYCFTSDGVEFLKDFAVHEVFDDYGIIGAKEQVDAALELLGDVVDTQDKKEIIGELITSLEENYNSQKSNENSESNPTPDPWTTPIENYGNEEVEQIAIEAQQVATELESLIEVSVRIPTVVVIFWYIAKYGEQIQELKNLIKNNPEKVKDVYDDIQRRFEQESKRLRQRVAIRFYSPLNQEYSDVALTEMGITLTNAEVDFYADGRPETNKSNVKKNNDKDPNYRPPVNVDENGNLTKVNNYVRSVVDNLISSNIQAERISFEDDYFAFVTDGMFVLVKEDTAVEIVWDPELDSVQMKVMLEEHRKEKNSYNLPQFCFLHNLKYTKIVHRNTKDEDNNLITNWITRQQQAITNPQDYVGWNVDRSREYDPKDVQQLVELGFDVEQISTLYSSINTYESFDQFEIYGLPTNLVDLDAVAFNSYINSLYNLTEKSFKKNQIASSSGKQETPEKIAVVLESNFDAIKSNPIFIDYITGFKSFLDKARILKLQLSSLPKVELDKEKINRINLFLGNVLSENKYKIDKSNSAISLMRVFLRARLDLLKQGHILNQNLN